MSDEENEAAKPLSDPAVRAALYEAIASHWPVRWDDFPMAIPRPDRETVLADLGALASECPAAEGGVIIDQENHFVTAFVRVTTEPITLDNEGWDEERPATVALGRFRVTVRLHVFERYLDDNVTAEALDPNPAVGERGFVHPHVNGTSVCKGSAATAFEAAVNAGRFQDAVEAILSVLRAYNGDSPYRALGDWVSRPCPSCDATSPESHGACHECGGECCSDCERSCEDCNEYFCGEHVTCCCGRRCGVTICNECSVYVEDRMETYCKSCARCCDVCGNGFLNEDLDGDDKCETCRQEECQGCSGSFDPDELNGDGRCEACALVECTDCTNKFGEDDLDENGRCDGCAAEAEDEDSVLEEDSECVGSTHTHPCM